VRTLPAFSVLVGLAVLAWSPTALAQECPGAGADACQDWLDDLSGTSMGSGFWKHQFQAAADGKDHGVSVAADDLDLLLLDLQAFFIPSALSIESYGEVVEVLEVVDDSQAGLKFGKELLVAELNYFSGETLDSPAVHRRVLMLSEILLEQVRAGVADTDEVAWYTEVLQEMNDL